MWERNCLGGTPTLKGFSLRVDSSSREIEASEPKEGEESLEKAGNFLEKMRKDFGLEEQETPDAEE